MPKPVMPLKEFQDRLLLEAWLYCEGDLAFQFDPHNVALSLLEKQPRAKASWIGSAINGLERDNLISRYSPSDGFPDPDEGKFYLSEHGLRWAERVHNQYSDYTDDDLAEDSTSLSDGMMLSGSPRIFNRRPGPIVVGRTAVGKGYVGRRPDSDPTDPDGSLPPNQTVTFDTMQSRTMLDSSGRILTENGSSLLTEDGGPTVVEGPTSVANVVGRNGKDILTRDGSNVVVGRQTSPSEGGTKPYNENIVDLDPNRAAWDRFSRELNKLSEAVRGHNGYTDEQRLQANRVHFQLDAASRMVKGKLVDLTALQALLMGSLAWIALTFLEGAISDMGAHASEQLRSLLGL